MDAKIQQFLIKYIAFMYHQASKTINKSFILTLNLNLCFHNSCSNLGFKCINLTSKV